MTLPGGAADKLGNRYELWWTLSQLVRMLQGDVQALRIEPPGIDKAEFVLTTGPRCELHQVKRSHPSGKWSLTALRYDGLLDAVGRQLGGNDDRFVFASASNAVELADLCEAARNAESLEEFRQAFLAAQRRSQHFETLIDVWACDAAAAFEHLRRIDVRTIDETGLEQNVRLGLQALFLANPKQVSDTLRGIAEHSVHRTLTCQDLVAKLSRRGYRLRRLTNPQSAGAAVREATDRYLSSARARLIRQQLVPREAAQTLLARVNDAPDSSVLTGRAGSGKTGCVVEFVEALRERGAPVLAFRLDRHVSAQTTAHLGKLLDIEESPSLVLAAAAEAAGSTGILVVDQLDAVSTASGRSAGALELVQQLLAEASGHSPRTPIHVVVVCREFDWNHDHRLRGLMPRSSGHVSVSEFTVEEVKTILADADFDPEAFRDPQLKILQLPQNLSLFLEAGFDAARAPTFRTAKEIFDRYWNDKYRVIEARAPAAAGQWMDVMKTLCDEMTSTQQLSVRKEKLDAFSPGFVDQLASEGVFTFDGHRYGFGHESFFDYVFARLFSTRPEPIAEFLKASEQHLFRRAQVRQILTYLREPYADRYAAELRSLLSDDGIRSHLKDLIFALLADVTDPTDEEWAIWKTWIDPQLQAVENGAPNPNKLSTLAWRRFFTSRPWFAEIDRRGLIESWLTSENDRLADMAVNYLRFHQRDSPHRVAALLEPYADRDGAWQLRLRHIMEQAKHHTSRRFFDLFLRLLDNGVLDEARDRFATNGTFWSMLYSLGKSRPEWVPEVLTRRLRRQRAVGEELHAGAFFDHDPSATRLIAKSAEDAPAAFVQHMLPIVLEISDAAATDGTPPRRDAVWRILFKSEYPNAREACLSGLAVALAALAGTGVVPLDDVTTDLRSRDTYVANYLLLSLYRGGASRHADEAVALLCDEPWRFQCGFSDSSNWCAMEMIRAVVPLCTSKSRERIEAVILNYVPSYERSPWGYRQFGRTRFDLLSAIPAEFRSRNASASFDELARKFGKPAPAPRGIVVSVVSSPIEEHAAKKMTDEQWLRAIVKYSSEERVDRSGDGLRGGARELARMLGERVKEDPNRFARLCLRFPADANPAYLQEALGALKGTEISIELRLKVCRKAFAEAPGSCGSAIADVLGSVEDPLPDDMVGMLDWLATRDNDPAQELWREDAGNGQAYYGGDILTAGINTTRGRAAWAIRDLILRDEAYVERFRATLERMVDDPNVAVRSCVLGTIRAAAFRDPTLGMSLFLNMDLSEERLLATHDVERFIHGNLRNRLAELRPLIERMLRSSVPEVLQAGGRSAGIAALLHGRATDLADQALLGDTRGRRGLAEVASAHVANPEFRRWCEARLVALFNDADAEVRREAASCFGNLPDDVLATCESLIAACCSSPVFEEDPFWLLHALEHSREKLPGTTCAVCRRYLGRMAGTTGDSRTHSLADAPTVAKLVFRTYQQHPDDEWTQPSLDLIDLLCLEGVAGARDELETFER